MPRCNTLPESGASVEQPLTAPTDKKAKSNKSQDDFIGEEYLIPERIRPSAHHQRNCLLCRSGFF
jgi:hypothetical protein